MRPLSVTRLEVWNMIDSLPFVESKQINNGWYRHWCPAGPAAWARGVRRLARRCLAPLSIVAGRGRRSVCSAQCAVCIGLFLSVPLPLSPSLHKFSDLAIIHFVKQIEYSSFRKTSWSRRRWQRWIHLLPIPYRHLFLHCFLKGVDLREYAKEIEIELERAERAHIEDCKFNRWSYWELTNFFFSCFYYRCNTHERLYWSQSRYILVRCSTREHGEPASGISDRSSVSQKVSSFSSQYEVPRLFLKCESVRSRVKFRRSRKSHKL